MLNMDTVFLGVSKATQRKFYHSVLSDLKETHPTLYIPCSGTFALVEVALQAGYQPSNIITSDISLFSSMLGYYITNRDIDELNYKICIESEDERHFSSKDEAEKIAHIMWLMKTLQIDEKVYFQRMFLKHFVHKKEEIILDLAAKIRKLKDRYAGIQYSIKDLRLEIFEEKPSDSVTIIHSPAYASGYSKMFDFGNDILFQNGVDEFSFSKEFVTLYDESRKKPEVYIWSAYDTTKGIPKEDVFFAEERTKNKYEYFCVTKTQYLSESSLKYSLIAKEIKECQPLPIPIISKDYKITKQTKIDVLKVSEEVALYYRDLWAHKMGTTKAEQYYLFLLDGAAFGVTGFHASEALRLVSNDVFEVFGFDQPLDNHPNAHKLFMMLLTCNDMKNVILNSCTKNRIFDLKGFKTVCVTKYRKLKSSTGLLEIKSREKLPNGNYKIMYYTPFWKRTFEETLAHWCDNDDITAYGEDDDENEGDSDAREFTETGASV